MTTPTEQGYAAWQDGYPYASCRLDGDARREWQASWTKANYDHRVRKGVEDKQAAPLPMATLAHAVVHLRNLGWTVRTPEGGTDVPDVVADVFDPLPGEVDLCTRDWTPDAVRCSPRGHVQHRQPMDHAREDDGA